MKSYVRYVMKDGVNLVDWRSTSLEEIEMGVKEAWTDRRPAVKLRRFRWQLS